MEDERIRFSTWKDFGYHTLSEQDALRKECDTLKKKIEDAVSEHNELKIQFTEFKTKVWTIFIVVGTFILGLIGIFQFALN